MPRFKSLCFAVFVMLLAVAMPCALPAQTITWSSGTAADASGTWDAASFNGQAYTAASALVIDGAATFNFSGIVANAVTVTSSGNTVSTAGHDVTLSGVFTASANWGKTASAGKLTLSNADNAISGSITIGDGTLSIGGAGRLSSGAHAAAITLTAATSGLEYASSTSQTLAGNISGAGQLIKAGSSTLTLSGTNTHTNDTRLNAGTLILASTNALQTSPLHLNGGTLVFDSTVASHAFTLGGLKGSGSLVLEDNASTPAAVAITVNIASGVDNTYSGSLSGTGSLTKVGNGTLTLSGASSHSGATRVSAGTLILIGSNSSNGTTDVGGILRVGPGALASGQISLSSPSTITGLADGESRSFTNSIFFSFAGATITFGDATAPGALNFSGSVLTGTASSHRTLNTNAATTFSGVLSGSNSTLIKTGAATLTLSNTGNSTTLSGAGGFVITAGTVEVTRLANAGTNSSLGRTSLAATAGSITLDGGTLTLIDGGGTASSTDRLLQIGRSTAGGSGTVLNNSSQALTFSNTNAIAYGSADQARSITLGGSHAGGSTLASAIHDNGTGVVSVTKQGTGTWTLSGTSSYSGGTRLAGGTLVVGSASALGSGPVSVTANSSLTAGASFTTDIHMAAGVTLGLTGGGFHILGGVISGAGNITSNASTRVFGANTHTGSTTITGGFFCIDGDASFGAVPAEFMAGNIIFNGGNISTYGAPGGSTIVLAASRGITMAGNGGVDVSNGLTLEFQGVISGTGNLTRNNSMGTLVLSGHNTYSGVTGVQVGTTVISTIKNVGDTTGSSLGNVSTVSAGTIGVGNSTSTGTLKYVGTGSTTDRVINLAGTTGSAVLDQSGTGLLLFTSSLTATGAGSKTLTLTGSTTGTGALAGAIVDHSATHKTALVKSGTGTWTLSGTNTYTGTTTVSGGVLQFAKRAALYQSNTGSWTATNLIVNNGAVAAFNVGGEGEFTAANIHMLQALTNVAAGATATQGFRSGSSIGLDTSNAVGGLFTYETVLADHVAATTTDTMGLRKLGTGTLRLTALNTYTGGTVVNGGTLELAVGGGTGAIRGALTINSGATVQVSAANGMGSTQNFRVTNTTINGGTLDIQNTGNNSLTSAILTLNGGSITGIPDSRYDLRDNGAGTTSVNVLASSTTSMISVGTLGMAGNNPTFTVAAGSTDSGVDLLITSVIVTNAGSGGVGGGVGNLTKAGAGLMQFFAANTYTGTTTISAGTLALAASGSTGTGVVTVRSGGTLLGTGVVRGSGFVAASGATVQAGDNAALESYGALSFMSGSGDSGSFDFQSGSRVILGINPGITSDLLSFDGLSAGTLQFHGDLQVLTAMAYVPTMEETFNLLDWANVGTATFASRYNSSSYAGYLLGNGDDNLGFDLPDISGSGYGWDISQFMLNGTISTVILVPELGRALLLLCGLGMLAVRRRRLW